MPAFCSDATRGLLRGAEPRLIAAGYHDFDHMQQDTDLAPLRGLPKFENLFPKPTGK